jgi:hypothetical protein
MPAVAAGKAVLLPMLGALTVPCERDGQAASQEQGHQAGGADWVTVERHYQGRKGADNGRGKLNHRGSIGQKHV